jgi:predicted nucleic acid-binding protein
VPKRGPHYLDTNIVISAIETASPLTQAQQELILQVDSGEIAALTSEMTLAECLVKPFADKDIKLIEAYMAFLDGRVNFPVLPVTRQILVLAARRRADLGIKLPDAIHVATAETAGCSFFVTNDKGVRLPEKMALVLWDRI